MIGKINKIIPMSVVDGDGNRTAIFLQGCNFNCIYCHNPETINSCIHCGVCIESCTTGALSMQNRHVVWEQSLCIDCDKCIEVCPHGSSPKIMLLSGVEVAKIVEENIPFITGITTSGGECTLQHKFLIELYTEVKKLGLNILTDTNAGVDLTLPKYRKLVQLSDGFMIDVKSWNKEDHHKLTGADNYTVKKNLKFLSSLDKIAEIRTVCIDGIDNEFVIKSCGEFLARELAKKPIPYKIIAYRHYGVRNEFQFLKSPSKEELRHLEEVADAMGFSPVIVV